MLSPQSSSSLYRRAPLHISRPVEVRDGAIRSVVVLATPDEELLSRVAGALRGRPDRRARL